MKLLFKSIDGMVSIYVCERGIIHLNWFNTTLRFKKNDFITFYEYLNNAAANLITYDQSQSEILGFKSKKKYTN